MARTEWHQWGRYIFMAVVIIFSCGGYAMKIIGNSANIEKNTKSIGANKDSVHKLELSGKDIANLAQKSVDQWSQVLTILSGMSKTQIEQGTILAVNSTKLETLTKD